MQLIVTAAGFAAIVNAENTGTGPVLVSQIGITDQVFTADAGDLVLPGELKRLSTFAGAAVANDTIHVTIRDDSADVYTLRGFGLYAADGTLLALYSQATTILEKSAQAMMLLAADVVFTQIEATSLTFGDTNWLNPPGTETVPGVLEMATDAETATGADNTRAVHPKGLKALLDSRFGAGAPSAFVKGLLSLATAALIRTALELGSAALRNEGTGNGLDADKLDGQEGAFYLSWANLTGKPATFAPSPHSHVWADITNPPTTATRWPTFDEVTGKPATYPPANHTHAAADIIAGTFADARIAASNVTQHQATLAIAWGQVTGKPATFTPSAHTHAASEIVSGTFALARLPALPTSQITGLDAALSAKALIAGGNSFSGKQRIGSSPPGLDGGAYANGQAEFASENGQPARVGFHNVGTDGAAIYYLGGVNFGAINSGGTNVNFWTSGNFDPNSKASLSQTVAFRDITANRGDGTGVIFFGSGTRYLYWDGNTYNLVSAGLNVGGTVSAPGFAQSSSRRYKTDIENITPERALELLSTLRLVSYRMRADGSEAMGVIAEELADGPLDFAVTRTANGDPEGVNYQPLFILASAALLGVADRVASLEARG
ncbi:tail fiber domain-containing protein [Lysobacter sp. TAF61]|uniref:tail fiber domain-containing protein n=1 Tax=Lysobacter sp. TAF61 TaxID=3233072 RepID=UPI003F9CE228